jgi:hypothetical protein
VQVRPLYERAYHNDQLSCPHESNHLCLQHECVSYLEDGPELDRRARQRGKVDPGMHLTASDSLPSSSAALHSTSCLRERI